MTRDPTADPGTRPLAVRSTDLDRLLDALRADGRTIVGPTVRDDAIILDEILSAADLPAGRGAEAGPGRYRLTRRDDARRFDHAVGPMSLEALDIPAAGPHPGRPADRLGRSLRGRRSDPDPARLHRRPRLRARPRSGIQDHVFLDGPAIDRRLPRPARRRRSSSPSSARRRPRPASARRWGPVRR